MMATVVVVAIGLAGLGFAGARFGGASSTKPTIRVVVGGLAAMAITIGVGNLFGAAIN
jgi:VIT1/CCC1 family predicted Fe2+/Mn2+ transporter